MCQHFSIETAAYPITPAYDVTHSLLELGPMNVIAYTIPISKTSRLREVYYRLLRCTNRFRSIYILFFLMLSNVILKHFCLQHELKEVEDKFRKAMVANAQLDNDKAAQTYQLELLKDRYDFTSLN